MKNIKTREFILGKNSYVSPKAIIRGVNGLADRIVIGDNTYIGDYVQIMVDDFKIGDYCKIHHNTNLHGYKPMYIGHNAWIGQNTIIDSIGGVYIENNCGIGAHSQLWSHIRYGDPLIGCNYENNKELRIGNDVWFVGHCIVSPITAEDRSMALAGSVVTQNMKYNRIYGGTPAIDLTQKIKPQFSDISLSEKRKIMSDFKIPKNIKLIEDDSEISNKDISYFNICSRKYTKIGTDEEVEFMLMLQKKLIKFTPY